MGSNKKHKKHKSERKERYDDRSFSLDRPPSLKLILKVGGGNCSTPEHGSNESPVYGVQPENLGLLIDYPEKHKKSKKKKRRKEKRHKHHKEKRRHRDEEQENGDEINDGDDSSQEDMSINEDSGQYQEHIMKYSTLLNANSPQTVSKLALPVPMKSLHLEPFTPSVLLTYDASPSVSSIRSDSMKSPSSTSDTSGREPRTCVLKLKQSKSPLSKLLEHLLRALEKKDPHQFFAWPVTDDIAPGYSSIITDPMDFLTIRQKVDDGLYASLVEFGDDFKLMCENAIKYNHVDTVYHKAAKRLLHVGTRMLQPENLTRSLRPLASYMRELTQKELGFDLTQAHHNEIDSQVGDSGDEGLSMGGDDVVHDEEDERRRAIRLENAPKSRFEAFVDDMTAEEILEQVQNVAKQARKKLSARKNASKMGFLRQAKDGTTSMQILVDTENLCPERVVSVGAFTGKLAHGTGQLQGFREDRRNNVKVVKPLNYGTFCSFAPIYDSRFANLSKEESEIVLNTYGDDIGSEYTASILEFSRDSQQASSLANSLLDFLTNGEHRKAMLTLTENSRQKYEQHEIEQTFPSPHTDDDMKKYENVQIDFDSLRSLSDIGVNVSFLNDFEKNMQTIEMTKKLQEQLEKNSTLIDQLHKVQMDRLSQNVPTHLSHIEHPNNDEIDLAVQITSNLTEMAKQLPPEAIVAPQALRKAMGVSNVGLEPAMNDQPNGQQQQQQKQQQQQHQQPSQQQSNNVNGSGLTESPSEVISNTVPVPMELEPDTNVLHHSNNSNMSASNLQPQVDLETELREFLEADNNGLSSNDDVGIEQMLLD